MWTPIRRSTAVVGAFLALIVLASPAAPPARAQGTCALDDAAILATNSVHISQRSQVTGDVVVSAASLGPTLAAGFELEIDRTASVTGDLKADSLRLNRDATVTGDLFYNTLSDGGATVAGAQHTPLVLPVLAMPAAQLPAVRPEAADVAVGSGQTVELAAGDYGDITVAASGVLRFSGGVYHVRSLRAVAGGGGACAFPCRSFTFRGPTDLRIAGRLATARDAFIGPDPSPLAPVGAADIVVYVHGTNAVAGDLLTEPVALSIGRDSTVQANLYAPNGTLKLDQGTTATGAFLARDVQVARDAVVAVASFFGNQPPLAHPQTAFTDGAGAIALTLTGTDPEAEDLAFAIAVAPAQGTLSGLTPIVPPASGRCSVSGAACADLTNASDCPVSGETCDALPVQPAVTSATVNYTPATAGDVEDSFTFSVSDPCGDLGMAVVQINPGGDVTPPPPPLTTVVALEDVAEIAADTTETITLRALAPDGVELTFATTDGPDHGALANLTQGGETPRRSATVDYTPEAGFTGDDSFTFEACGTIDDVVTCDTAVVGLQVVLLQASAEPQGVATPLNTPVTISLGGSSGLSEGSFAPARRRFITGKAAFLDGAEVAGNVADADENGAGDNHNALPGSVPVFMSAGVDLSGGAGSNGTVRMQIEWDLSGLEGLAAGLESAEVILHTHRGSIDALDTFFFAGTADQDGLLTDADFQAPAQALAGVVMPVPPLEDMPLGSDGTFSFDVLSQLRAAIVRDDVDHFSISGRVDENLVGPARGLEVRTTASGNLGSFLEPQLAVATPGVTAPPLTFSIISLPLNGTLLDAFNNPITAVPTMLAGNSVTYSPDPGFAGVDSFEFQVDDAATSTFDTALVSLVVHSGFGFGDCATNVLYCQNGRF